MRFAAFPFKGVALQDLPQVSYTEDFKAFPSKGVALRGSFNLENSHKDYGSHSMAKLIHSSKILGHFMQRSMVDGGAVSYF